MIALDAVVKDSTLWTVALVLIIICASVWLLSVIVGHIRRP